MKNLAHILILVFFVFWIDGCEQKPIIEPSGKTIKIGMLAPLSGPDEIKGKEGLRGIQFAMLMQPHLQNGDRIELVTADDKNDPALTVPLLEKMVEKDQVSAIITFSTSDPVLAMAKVADENKTPILAAIATHPDITKQNDFISHLCFDDHFQGTTAALFVRDEMLVDNVAVFINPDSAYSRDLAAEFKKKFESIGGEITDTIRLAEETANLYKEIKRVHDHAPELLYLPIRAEDVLLVIREVRELRWKPQMMGSDGLLSTMIKQHKKELNLVEGMLAIDFFAHEVPPTPFGEKVKDAYHSKYKGKLRAASTSYSALGVEGYALLLDAMNRCNDPADRECLNSQIRSTTNFTGLAGNITIGPDGKAERPLYINSIQNGISKFVVKVY
jgi:branched-chain amino acid transport system substrate-binding protein